MDSKTKDVVEDLRSHTKKFSNMHNLGLNEKASFMMVLSSLILKLMTTLFLRNGSIRTPFSMKKQARVGQILEILRKPYDKEEHERLMQEITKRKPQHKHRYLRSGGNITDDESFIPWNDKECVHVQPEGS
ncbi:hypothetical protein M9H77_11482 [Catharanthus roseus]|uniref:Uncharacterized protein n=1 Tax=Catharanthus roseus TaxID=4058 RepID=A0ACC0BER8_CATRO|nr:hypothetical protein M9H77_11482 [Catharanthus roseus]